MSTGRTLGVVVEQTGEEPPAFRAGVVWGAIPWVAGLAEAPSREAALAVLRNRMESYGYGPVCIVAFETVEAAQAEGRRRLAASGMLRALKDARARLPGILAGEETAPDEIDRGHLAAIDNLLRAVAAVHDGCYDERRPRDEPPIQDGRIVCPACSPDYPDAYFTATAAATVTVRLSPSGRLKTWEGTHVSEDSYSELQCGSCGRSLGDLSADDLRGLRPEDEEESRWH